MSENCLFCKIIAGEIPSKTVYEDEVCIAFNDIGPQPRLEKIKAAANKFINVFFISLSL